MKRIRIELSAQHSVLEPAYEAHGSGGSWRFLILFHLLLWVPSVLRDVQSFIRAMRCFLSSPVKPIERLGPRPK
jgi:hypothetical protein